MCAVWQCAKTPPEPFSLSQLTDNSNELFKENKKFPNLKHV